MILEWQKDQNKHTHIYQNCHNLQDKNRLWKAIHQLISIVFECYVPLKSENL